MTLFARLLVIATALPLALATFTGSGSAAGCKSSEFYWSEKSCCLPQGGSKNPPSPPKGTSCPTKWEWHGSKGYCVPQAPPTSGTPSCSSGWGWNKGRGCCEQHPTTSKYTPPAPSTTKVTPPTPTPSTPAGGDCKPGQWWWGEKNCCLPHGGQPNPPKPPSGQDCPPNWEWDSGKKHCVPQHPSLPPPQCGSGWGWDNGSKCCFPHGSTPPVPTPSGKPGKPGQGGYGHHKRAKARNVSLCPNGLQACPIAGLTGLTDDWECLDTANELESCGGCASTGAGQDCTAIPGAWNVACKEGKCVVFTCADGYLRSLDNKSCVKV
ncbi:hypothetical protein C8Q74DRAFT_1435702 [Fomes fomentarius]|nr:hypothetical protein C8Q74DRAFT_1435702 [Fomes fomentarius]